MPWMMALVDSMTSVIMDIDLNSDLWPWAFGLWTWFSICQNRLNHSCHVRSNTKTKVPRPKIAFLALFYTNSSRARSLPTTIAPDELVSEAVHFVSAGGDLFQVAGHCRS